MNSLKHVPLNALLDRIRSLLPELEELVAEAQRRIDEWESGTRHE